MAASPYATIQYNSERFVESCGAILFDLSDSQNKKVCLIYYRAKDEWLLAKGRRNCGESRHEAALREVCEETGYQARLYPVTMYTRAPPIDEQGYIPDKPRSYQDLTEPFMQRQKPAERSDVGTETFLPAKGSGMLLNLAHVNGERAADPSGISVFYSAMNA
ncbi:NUDIX domain [Penicillium cf. griseofulvum]|nr:NUDIX domain [Penicillium cf. griseofulvum]